LALGQGSLKVLQFSYQYNSTSTTAAVPSWHERNGTTFYLYQNYVETLKVPFFMICSLELMFIIRVHLFLPTCGPWRLFPHSSNSHSASEILLPQPVLCLFCYPCHCEPNICNIRVYGLLYCIKCKYIYECSCYTTQFLSFTFSLREPTVQLLTCREQQNF